tara:strand:+ start:2328 stop:3023 length:696 start_codon:yes stop_codon:yes gene_type:complete
MYKNFSRFVFIFLILGFSQAQKNIILKNSSDYGLGLFSNVGSEGFEIDGYIEANLLNGFFFELGINQIDLDEESSIQLIPSLGFAYQIKKNMSMGLGYSLYTNIENNNDNEDEFFLGSILGPLTGVISYDINTNFFNYLFIIDFNFGPLKSLPISLSSYNYIENDNFDFNLRLEKDLNKNLSIGYIISRERYDYEPRFQSKVKGKNYGKSGKSLLSKDEAFFHTFYLGFLF